MSSSFRRVISQLSPKLPRVEDREILDTLMDEYEKGGAEGVKIWLERMLKTIESE